MAVALSGSDKSGHGVGHDETPPPGSASSTLAYRRSAGKWPLERLTY